MNAGRELAEIDASLNRGVAQLNEQITTERAKRADDLKALSADMKELVRGLERRHQSLEEAASQADAELRERSFYTPDRNGPLAMRETAWGEPGRWWQLSVSGSF